MSCGHGGRWRFWVIENERFEGRRRTPGLNSADSDPPESGSGHPVARAPRLDREFDAALLRFVWRDDAFGRTFLVVRR
jgi:hypothetical protein